MPTLADLGDGVRTALLDQQYLPHVPNWVREQLSAGLIPLGNVEMWLSSLAEGQPFMSQSEALRNRALFGDLSELVVALVTKAQDNFWQSAPEWLHWLHPPWP